MRDKAILVFGSFNPPTIAHVKISETLHKIHPDAKIYYVIAKSDYVRSWKNQSKVLPMFVRGELLLGAIDRDYALVSHIEKKLDGKAYNTIAFFKEKYKEVYVCIGEDNLPELPKWYNYEKLIEENKFIVLERDHTDVVTKCSTDDDAKPGFGHNNFSYYPFNCQGISSTKIRDAYRNNNLDSIKDDVPDNVYNFLKNSKGVL